MIPLPFANGPPAASLPKSKRGRFLLAAADLFEESGASPTIEEVQDLLLYRRDSTDAAREAKRLSWKHGWLEGETVVLTVRGIHHVDPNHPALRHFERGLDFAATTYRRRDRRAKARVSVADLRDLREHEARVAITLLVAEELAVPGESEGEAATVAPAIGRYFAARGVGDYLKAQSGLRGLSQRLRRSRPKATRLAVASGRAAVARVLLSTAAIILATLVLWVANQALGSAEHQARKSPEQTEKHPPSVRGTPAGRPPPAPAGRR